jgi:hypothetical protein
MRAGIYDCAIDGGPTDSLPVMPIQTSEPDRQEYQSVFN